MEGTSVWSVRLALGKNTARATFAALRAWGKARPPETRTLMCVIPGALGAIAGIVLWVFVPPHLALYLSILVVLVSIGHTVLTAVAFFAGGESADVEKQIARLGEDRQSLGRALERAKWDRSQRRREERQIKAVAQHERSQVRAAQQEERARYLEAQAQQRAVAQRMRAQQQLACPRCGSTQVHSDKKGYSVSTGGCGFCLLGPVGLILGLLGSSSVVCRCLACGRRFTPGRGRMV